MAQRITAEITNKLGTLRTGIVLIPAIRSLAVYHAQQKNVLCHKQKGRNSVWGTAQAPFQLTSQAASFAIGNRVCRVHKQYYLSTVPDASIVSSSGE